ncbi:tRNA pseudouridine synthase A, partial [Bienertia sinuspersici]
IIVRVIKLWEVPNYINLEVIYSIELVLIHKQGSKIQESIQKTIMQRFSNMGKEGSCRIITKFGVVSNIGKQRATNPSYKINFLRDCCRECEDVQIPLHGLDFTSFDKIMKNKVDDTILVDVIGEVTVIGDLVNVSKDSKPNYKLAIELEDLW